LAEWRTFTTLLCDEVHRRLGPAGFADLTAEMKRQFGSAISRQDHANQAVRRVG
jgi:hypothetical protein